MVNQSSIVAPRFLPIVCRCVSPIETESDCVVGDPTFREIVFCIDCGNPVELSDAIFQARVSVNPQFDQDWHVLDFVLGFLDSGTKVAV